MNGLLVILIGPPGVGKGTLADRSAGELDFLTVSTGEIFRKNIADQTELGKAVGELVLAGKLVPDELVNDIFKAWFFAQWKEGAKILLDGYPRSLAQTKFLLELLKQEGLEGQCMVYLMQAPFDVVKSRVMGRMICSNPKCKKIHWSEDESMTLCDVCSASLIRRFDDTLEVLIHRFDEYTRTCNELMEYFQKYDITIHTVDVSSMGKFEVFEDFKQSILHF